MKSNSLALALVAILEFTNYCWLVSDLPGAFRVPTIITRRWRQWWSQWWSEEGLLLPQPAHAIMQSAARFRVHMIYSESDSLCECPLKVFLFWTRGSVQVSKTTLTGTLEVSKKYCTNEEKNRVCYWYCYNQVD